MNDDSIKRKRLQAIFWFSLLLILDAIALSAQGFEVIGQKDGSIYIKGLDENHKYDLEKEGIISTRRVTADECGIVTLRNSKKYPITANGNYFDIYFQQQDYWYYWTNFTNPNQYPKLKCNKVGGEFEISGNIYNAIDGTGSQSFVVFPDFIQIYHPQIIKPFSQHTITWYGEWGSNNYLGNTSTSNLSTNACGIGRLSIKKFKERVWNFLPGEFQFTIKDESNTIGSFDPVPQEIKFKPLCRNGVLYEPESYL